MAEKLDEKALAEWLKSFCVYTVEDDEDSIRLSMGGQQIACWSANSPQGTALLKFDAAHREALAPSPPSGAVSSEPITQKEMIELFGSEMPIEAVSLLYDCPDDWTIADVRRKLREIAAALPAPSVAKAVAEDWRDDPSADERWNAGLDYGQTQLCHVLGIDPATVNWDAATETLDGDVQAVIGNILTARFGDDWRSALAHPLPAEVGRVLEDAALEAEKRGRDLRNDDATRRGCAYAATLVRNAARDLLSKTGRRV